MGSLCLFGKSRPLDLAGTGSKPTANPLIVPELQSVRQWVWDQLYKVVAHWDITLPI